jgi:hypothetical protein
VPDCDRKIGLHFAPVRWRDGGTHAELVNATTARSSHDAPCFFNNPAPSRLGLHAEHGLTEQNGGSLPRQAGVFSIALDEAHALALEPAIESRYDRELAVYTQVRQGPACEHLLCSVSQSWRKLDYRVLCLDIELPEELVGELDAAGAKDFLAGAGKKPMAWDFRLRCTGESRVVDCWRETHTSFVQLIRICDSDIGHTGTKVLGVTFVILRSCHFALLCL